MSTKLSKNFYDWEFVPPYIHHSTNLLSQWYISQFMIDSAEFIRERMNKPVYINTYLLKKPDFMGITFKESGFRLPDTKTGSPLSQHKIANALDIKILGIDYEELRQDIRNNFSHYNKVGITTIEKNTPTWLHIDGRITGMSSLYEVGFK